MKKSIVVDTNIICALYNPEDSLYEKAQRIKSLFTEYKPIVSNFILLEAYTILSQRISKEFAVSFGRRIKEKHSYAVVWISPKLEEEVWRVFVSIKDKNFSYVDASILAVIKKGKISHLLSFDAGFAQFQNNFGFTLIES